METISYLRMKPSSTSPSTLSPMPILSRQFMRCYRKCRRLFHHHRSSLSKKGILIIIFFIGQALVLLYFHFHLDYVPSTDAAGSLLDDFMLHQKTNNVTTALNNQQQRLQQSTLYNIDPIEEKEAMDYIRSFQRGGGGDNIFARPLNFFHIPKTAGTAVEQAGAEHVNKYSWGSCAFYHKPKRDICNYPQNSQEWPRNVGWWHIPRQFFPLAQSNPYQNSELFAVIRDPLERMVSEFYYICTLKIKDWRPNQCDRDRLFDEVYMNEWLQNKLKPLNNNNNSTSLAMSYLNDNGHFTPQYEFLVGPHEVRMIDHVLRLEGSSHVKSTSSSIHDATMTTTTRQEALSTTTSLAQDFQRLVQAYNMPKDLQLTKMNAISAEARNSSEHLQVQHLNRYTTLPFIHSKYPHDLEMLGYNNAAANKLE